MPSPGIKWSEEDTNTFMRLRRRGMTHRHIAHTLGRSCRSVSDKARRLRVVGLIARPRADTPARNNPKTIVLLAQLPDWYALGWHVSQFDGGLVDLEWPHDSNAPFLSKVATS